MDELPAASSAERELRELRERAYGPHPDIEDDPIAIARLIELEAARAGIGAPVPNAAPTTASIAPTPSPVAPQPPPGSATATTTPSPDGAGQSLWHRAKATRSSRLWLIAGGSIAALALMYAVSWAVGPHPDATLRSTAAVPDAQVNGRMGWVLDLEVDPTTLRGFEDYRGLEIWAAEDVYGSPCLIVIHPTIDRPLGDECTPPATDLLTDATVSRLQQGDFGDDLPAGSVIRFQYRGDSVDVYLYPATGGAG